MIRILFTAANPVWTAIEQAHAVLLGGLDRSEFEIHLACTTRAHGGSGPTALERAAALRDVHVYATDFGPSLQGATRARALDLIKTSPRVPLNLLGLARYVAKHRIDVIHGSQKPYDALSAVLLAKVMKRKSVVHVHVKYEPWLGPRVRWALRNADAIVGVSRFTAESVRSQLEIAEARLHYVHNPLDASAWPPGGDGARVRRELQIPDGAPLLGMVGRLNQWKGQADLLDALRLVRKVHPSTHALIVGDEDPWSHGSRGYAAELREKASWLGVADHVRWSPFRRDIRDVMAALDVFVFPAWEEPFGMVFLEAMAMQKPVAAIASGAAPEIIVEGETGLLVPPKQPDKLAEAIASLLSDPKKREAFGRAGRKRVEVEFAPARAARKLAAIYQGLVR